MSYYTRVVYTLLFFVIFWYRCRAETEPLNNNTFPEGFLFGVASSSYQIEGAWNENGKGESIWDHLTHEYPSMIEDGRNGDIACDSYHKYKEDVQLIKNLGVNFYRFSLSWSRILPTGFTNQINPDGIRYYNNLIDELLAYNITPMVTLFHWDLPQPLQDIGGWPNPLLVDHFVNFAQIAFENFGDRVKIWITFNEGKQICKYAYGDGFLAPALQYAGVADYLCAYTVLKAHALTYHLYNDTYRSEQNGIVGFTMHTFWYEPNTATNEDIDAAHRLFEFYLGIFANPIFGSGDFPEIVKENVAKRSTAQGYATSRLPTFTTQEIEIIKGSYDFFGLNYYTALIVENLTDDDLNVTSWESDALINWWQDPEWSSAASPWLKVVPWSLRKILKKIKYMYGDVPIYITENGYSDHGSLDDYERANYYLTYLSACLEAIYEDRVNLVAYTAWTLMDNFEWMNGYVERFGLHHVDFDAPDRPRTPKLSAKIFANIVKDRKLPETTMEIPEDNAATRYLAVQAVVIVAFMTINILLQY